MLAPTAEAAMADAEKHTGRCECGAVSFEIAGPLPSASLCHCSQCRRQGSHAQAWLSVAAPRVALKGEANLKWYASSKAVQRGFCAICGSSVIGRYVGSGNLEIAAGALDSPSGTRVTSHIFVGSKGDYYDIDDDLPKYEEFEPASD
jgi:hypothetical protein